MRRPHPALLLATLFLLAASFALGWVSGGAVGRLGVSLTLPGGLPLVPPGAYRPGPDDIDMTVFWEAMGHLDGYYAQEELPRGDGLTYAAIEGVIEATSDPHTSFMEPQQAEIARTRLEGEFEGIGIYVEMEDEGLLVVSPIPDSPAARAGLRTGDIITEVDGTSLIGIEIDEAVGLLRGPVGSEVEITVRRPDVPELLEFAITRDRVPILTVETELIESEGSPTIGVLRLNRFGANTAREVRDGITELREGGAERLVLDLRNNGGGLLQSAIDVTSQFIADGIILSELGSNGRDRVYNARGDGLALDLPLVVLINQGSASASEIVAGAIRDRDRGTLVGSTSFGKGSVQITHDLSDGSAIRVTVARWFTPSGEAIHEVGIVPDLIVEGEVESDSDPQLEAAVELLRNQTAGTDAPGQIP